MCEPIRVGSLLSVNSNSTKINDDDLRLNNFREASVALVTPLRDGMNLVAKEFVACQIDEPGVLILSPFAGSGNIYNLSGNYRRLDG